MSLQHVARQSKQTPADDRVPRPFPEIFQFSDSVLKSLNGIVLGQSFILGTFDQRFHFIINLEPGNLLLQLFAFVVIARQSQFI